jgi:Na+-translocating ferredoxin:NAD+ oxidoreductase subunit B
MPLNDLAQRIDTLLPQTQCQACGYDACKPYAAAVAHDEAGINQCAPGGDAVIEAIAALTGKSVIPLSVVHGPYRAPQIAVIDEQLCIGCAKCLPACPVDAIIGARKRMHTVFDDWCTGCELCVPPCPMDCISFVPSASIPDAALSRDRFAAHVIRMEQRAAERAARLDAMDTLEDF